MPRTKQSLGEQAARFSLYAPLVAFALGFFSRGEQRSVAIVLVSINVLLLVAGLGMGVFALFSMRWYGRQGIMGRAITGVVYNGVAIAAMVTFLLPLVLVGNVRTQLAGRWELKSAPTPAPGTLTMTLTKEGSFVMQTTILGQTTTMTGEWELSAARVLGMKISHVENGASSSVGRVIAAGIVKLVDDTQLILQTDRGQEVYTRIQ